MTPRDPETPRGARLRRRAASIVAALLALAAAPAAARTCSVDPPSISGAWFDRVLEPLLGAWKVEGCSVVGSDTALRIRLGSAEAELSRAAASIEVSLEAVALGLLARQRLGQAVWSEDSVAVAAELVLYPTHRRSEARPWAGGPLAEGTDYAVRVRLDGEAAWVLIVHMDSAGRATVIARDARQTAGLHDYLWPSGAGDVPLGVTTPLGHERIVVLAQRGTPPAPADLGLPDAPCADPTSRGTFEACAGRGLGGDRPFVEPRQESPGRGAAVIEFTTVSKTVRP